MLAFMLLSLSYTPLSSASIQDCDKYDTLIEDAVETHWGMFDYPDLWKAQLYQESQCDPYARSPVGAQGFAQFMPGTVADMERRRGKAFNPYNAEVSIDTGAYYMALLSKGWKSKRTDVARHKLAVVSYNSGQGNWFKAQKLCNGALLWEDIKYCVPRVVGKTHSKEALEYWPRTREHAEALTRDTPWRMPEELRVEQTQRIVAAIQDRYEVRRLFNGTAWGTYWTHWDGWITANHVHNEMERKPPPWIREYKPKTYRMPGQIDAALYGVKFPKTPPPYLKEGQHVYILGFPGGSSQPSLRQGYVYLKRRAKADTEYITPAVIVAIITPSEYVNDVRFDPVIGGMSGGVVVSADTLQAVGILVAQNSPHDINRDGVLDQSADVIELRDVWEELNPKKGSVSWVH